MMTTLQNIVILGAQGFVMLMLTLANFDKHDYIKIKRMMFRGLVMFIKNFDPITLGGLEHPKHQ